MARVYVDGAKLAHANLVSANFGRGEDVRARVMEVLLDEKNRKWWTLAAVAFGLFMIMLDNTVVNVALPSIERDLHVSISSLEWIVTAYALTFAALLITGGKL